MPKFKRGGAGTPAIMSEPPKPEAPVADPSGVKGARATEAPTVAAPPDSEATEAKDRNSDKRKPGRPRKSAAAPEKDDSARPVE